LRKEIKIILVVLLAVFLFSCTSEKKTMKDGVKETDELTSVELNVKFNEIYSWINLMPGPKAKPRFHITGELEVYESGAYEIDKLNLTQINIYQNSEVVYSIKPEVRQDEKLSNDKMRFLIFSTIRGLLITEKLNTNIPVDAKFIFEYDDNMYSYFVKDVKIEKAY